MIKKIVMDMCGKTIDTGISHVESEIGLKPATFARTKSTVSAQINKTLDDYSSTRAFEITGLIKEDILTIARDVITSYVKANLELIPSAEFEKRFLELVKDYLPLTDSAGRKVNPAVRAQVIARTNISDLYNFTRMTMYSNPPLDNWVKAFMFSAMMDGRTTPLCRALNGRIFLKETLNGYLPPVHYNCRSTILPITSLDKDWEKAYSNQRALDVVPDPGFEQ